MADSVFSGLRGSLSAYVAREVAKLSRSNAVLQRSRYSLGRRLMRALVVDRSIAQLCLCYLLVVVVLVLGEQACHRYAQDLTPGYPTTMNLGFLKDVASYLIAAQIGILAIVSVAVGVVTLLSERDDGASINTDVRLYYVESYSYELAVSGVSLLLILTVQLFWPLQHVLHALPYGRIGTWSELTLSIVHAAWFCVNLLLFFQFISTTLRFVEPSSREALRERYSANEVIPGDAAARLTRAMYANLGLEIFGRQATDKGPFVTFTYNIVEHATPEVTVSFKAPMQLADVYVRPLRWALTRWKKRVRAQPVRDTRSEFPSRSDYLAVMPDFDRVMEGEFTLVRLQSAERLSTLERWVIRRCFRFSRATHSPDALAPDNFLEQLIDRLIGQIEQGAVTGFRAALRETVRYHRFILAAQSTKDDAGNPFNMAEVGGYFSRPDADWVRQYRRAFAAAADKIGTDTTFIDRLSNLAMSLAPRDGLNFSPRVFETLLELGPQAVLSLEDWVSKRTFNSSETVPENQAMLSGSDRRAYESALIGFVGGWESLLQTIVSSFSPSDRSTPGTLETQWSAFSRSFSVLQAHLVWTSYFLAVAVWNRDTLGADRYRDLLLRWPHCFYAELEGSYAFGNALLLMPDLEERSWPDVHAEIVGRMRFGQESALPGPVSALVLKELHCDVICISGLVALHWYATDQQSSYVAAEAAVLTLTQKRRDADGTDLVSARPKSTFRLLFDFVVRYALNPRFKEGSHAAAIDALIGRLTDLASPRMVGGRTYGRFGSDGLERIYFTLLASMAANLPAQGDDGVTALMEILKTDPRLAPDQAAVGFVWTMKRMIQCLEQVQAEPTESYSKAARTFDQDVDLDAATTRLKELLSNVVASFEALRKERIANAPLDEDRLDRVRRRVSGAILDLGPDLTCFHRYRIASDSTGAISTTTGEFGWISRGLFTAPQMSVASFDEIPGMFTQSIRSILSNTIWRDFYRRPKRTIEIDVSINTESFWQRAFDESVHVGPDPILLVPYDSIGQELTMADIYKTTVAGYTLLHEQGIPSGMGTGYLGTLRGIRVYSWGATDRHAILCSAQIMRGIYYGVVHGDSDLVDISFIDEGDPERCRVHVNFAQRIEWADHPFVEITLAPATAASQ